MRLILTHVNQTYLLDIHAGALSSRKDARLAKLNMPSHTALLIRTARDEDSAAIQDMLTKSWMAAYAPLHGETWAASRLAPVVRIENFIAQSKDFTQFLFIVGEIDGEIVGFAMASPGFWFGQLVVWMLYVHPECQGLGIGTALLERVSELLPSYSKVRLQVLERNIAGINFYRGRGFRIVRRSWHIWTWAPIFVMERSRRGGRGSPASDEAGSL